MLKLKNHCSFPLSILFLASASFIGSVANAGAGIGVDIYCVMRQGGNSHDASWRAAYQSIKTQKQGLFKTSPKQAASLIVEEVVQNPTKYEDCINYLGDLYTSESSSIGVYNDKDLTSEVTSSSDSAEKTPKGKYVDRYSY